MKKVLLLLCLSSFLTLPVFGDSISFIFGHDINTPFINVDASGVSLTLGQNVAIVDTTLGSLFLVPGDVSIFTGAATSYNAAGGVLVAQFAPGAGVQVEVDSAFCGGICLLGSLNTTGTYVATLGSTGSFQALFKVDYVSPAITSAFGVSNAWSPVGSDVFTTSDNLFLNGGTTDLAVLGGGAITFQTVPEPTTLGLFGSGLVALTMFVKRKVKGN